MSRQFNYSLGQIFEFPIGTRFQDQQGNRYRISEQFGEKTLGYPIVTQKIVQAKFKIIEE